MPENINFLSAFLEKRKALPIYTSLVNTFSKNIIHNSNNYSKKQLYYITDFPSYLKAEAISENWKTNVINSYKGSVILLDNYTNTNDYLKKKFKTPKRFRIYKSKLETSFNIEYKSYFGNISKDNYDYLFSEFYKMLKNRFLEKEERNDDLTRWKDYYEMAYPLINNKEAVLFVIYNDKTPISCYLNLLNQNTIYGYIKSYDIDYSKFSIGFISFLQQLQWCFENNIKVYDLLKGNYPYKNKLIDEEFYYQKHIIYNSKSLLSTYTANVLALKLQTYYGIIKILKNLNIDILYRKFSNFIYRRKIDKTMTNILVENVFDISTKDLIKIDLNNNDYSFLKRVVYKFLYHYDESLKSIEVFNLKNDLSTFYVKGTKQIQQIKVR
ncbi:GNAT family N-acetyltransferase [Sabulilitoribacter multivorans]|uniref:GNAT family N-acetyltransferase n=1 Tax=Flaviramulus multivorans TaxID=1304750 RepID=A0ABS9IJL1_9FLAO|nr:GNAT family N-acetyltransferase [Flaviramulus multivorans]MCF7560794.1 GNAT family N-acetyltransferase [Flaviramulus multivorans]